MSPRGTQMLTQMCSMTYLRGGHEDTRSSVEEKREQLKGDEGDVFRVETERKRED